MKIKHLQSFFKSLGDNSCYLLSLINIAEEYIGEEFSETEKLRFILWAIDNKAVKFNKDNMADTNNFFVLDPCRILYNMTLTKWDVNKEEPREIKKGEYVVEYWALGKNGHFARTYRNYNSIENSKCTSLGKIESLRVFVPKSL